MTLPELLDQAGLTGRGGAAFRTHIKVAAAHDAGADLIVNACDGERGAAKDGWVVAHHLDELVTGARLVAPSRNQRILFAAHRDSATARRLHGAGVEVIEVPERYVSSEETSLIARAHGLLARPLRKHDRYVTGGTTSAGDRISPTVVLNAETVWRIAQIEQYGPDWFRGIGLPDEPGPRLVTLSGAVSRPLVMETASGVPLADLLAAAGAAADSPVLVGGLAGAFLDRREAAECRWAGADLARYGAMLGPGVIEVLDPRQCPVRFVAQLLSYAGGESAGQCGPCMFGVPAVAADWAAATASADPAALARLRDRTPLLRSRGACRFPDGIANFTASALRVFGDHLAQHVRGCPAERTSRVSL